MHGIDPYEPGADTFECPRCGDRSSERRECPECEVSLRNIAHPRE